MRICREMSKHWSSKSMTSLINKFALKLGSNTSTSSIRRDVVWRAIPPMRESSSIVSTRCMFWPQVPRSLSLIRLQTRAQAHQFEKSCKDFKQAFASSSEERAVVSGLRIDNKIAPPRFDYVGPVEIRQSSSSYQGRGLFTTRAVKAGELLLISHPLASVKQKLLLYPDMFTSRVYAPFDELVHDLNNRIKTCKRSMVQLFNLSRYQRIKMDVPAMELFRPHTHVAPGVWSKVEMLVEDKNIVRDISYLNAMSTTTLAQLRGCQNYTNEMTLGIWALPSFANHSCSPNVVQDLIGTAIYFRASADMMAGEELTISYLHEQDLLANVETRQGKISEWFFRCKCQRCLLEESLREKFRKISTVFPELLEAAKFEGRYEQEKPSSINMLSDIAFEVECLIQSSNSEFHQLGSKEQGWIRAIFVDAYLAELQLVMEEGDSNGAMTLLKLVLDSLTSVGITPGTLTLATRLLWEVEQQFSKDSHFYWLTLDKVLSIYKVAFGDVPNDVVVKLVKA